MTAFQRYRRLLAGLLIVTVLAGLMVAFLAQRRQKHLWQYTSASYRLDGIYPSMRGPGEGQEHLQIGAEADELNWLTGYRATMVDESGKLPVGQQFMCHNSLFLETSVADHRAQLGTRPYGSARLFTLAQGSTSLEFTEGYAMPLSARETLQLHSQTLNLLPEHVGRSVRHRVSLEFTPDSELSSQPKPLFMTEATALVLVDGPALAGATRGKPAPSPMRKDAEGRLWAGHWAVPPGRSVNVTRVTAKLALPFDTTLHYACSHLHPYAVEQRLVDVTSGTDVYVCRPRWSPDGRILEEVPALSSPQGVPLAANHEYDLVTTYNNTSKAPVTAMSIVFLYCWDREFVGFHAPRAGSGPARTAAKEPGTGAGLDFCGSAEGATR